MFTEAAKVTTVISCMQKGGENGGHSQTRDEVSERGRDKTKKNWSMIECDKLGQEIHNKQTEITGTFDIKFCFFFVFFFEKNMCNFIHLVQNLTLEQFSMING